MDVKAWLAGLRDIFSEARRRDGKLPVTSFTTANQYRMSLRLNRPQYMCVYRVLNAEANVLVRVRLPRNARLKESEVENGLNILGDVCDYLTEREPQVPKENNTEHRRRTQRGLFLRSATESPASKYFSDSVGYFFFPKGVDVCPDADEKNESSAQWPLFPNSSKQILS